VLFREYYDKEMVKYRESQQRKQILTCSGNGGVSKTMGLCGVIQVRMLKESKGGEVHAPTIDQQREWLPMV
jgi:hypothetical protein